MSALAALQRAFQRHVYRPGPAMARHIAAGPRAGAARRLEVYASAYRARLAEALEEDYPALRVQLGARGFAELAREFIAARPSAFRNLRWYGAELVRLLGRSPLAELARFEWTLGLAFDAADAPLVRAADLAAVPAGRWAHLRLRLHPSVHRLSLRSNAPQAWRAAVREGRRIAPRRRPRAAEWLVWRRGFDPFYRALAADEAAALDAVARGGRFSAVCALLARHVGTANAPTRGAQLLRTWLAEGLVCSFE
jgi:hypothetical protein